MYISQQFVLFSEALNPIQTTQDVQNKTHNSEEFNSVAKSKFFSISLICHAYLRYAKLTMLYSEFRQE